MAKQYTLMKREQEKATIREKNNEKDFDTCGTTHSSLEIRVKKAKKTTNTQWKNTRKKATTTTNAQARTHAYWDINANEIEPSYDLISGSVFELLGLG